MKHLIFITLLLATMSCKKSNNSIPNGDNIIRYTVNGEHIEISGKYSNFTLSGTSFYNNLFQGNALGISGNNNSNNGITLIFPNNIIINNQIIIDTNNFSNMVCSFVKNNIPHDYNPKIGECRITLTSNNSDFVSGTFYGSLILADIGSPANDSINITNGYFNISKK